VVSTQLFLYHSGKVLTVVLLRSDFKKGEFKLKKFEEHDVDIAIEACGVCASDLHTITGGWGDAPLPLCVGHEVVGKVVKVGDKVTNCKVGDRGSYSPQSTAKTPY
jgi:alcohol dehydrogenase (NADP+)